MKYDVIIIGAGPGGIFAAYELTERDASLRIAVIEAGHSLEKRHCPIDGDKVKTCIKCKSCSIPTVSITSPMISAARSTSTSARIRLWS